MVKLISLVTDFFNEETIDKIKRMIDSDIILDAESLDQFVNPDSINKTSEGIKINELSVYSDEFDKISKQSKNDLHNLLNEVLPKECKSPEEQKQKQEVEVESKNMDELIGLIDQKINLITDMIE